jgi:hypothetical protein
MKWSDQFWPSFCFAIQKPDNFSGFQMVITYLVGRFNLSGNQMVGYQMPGSKVKWTI